MVLEKVPTFQEVKDWAASKTTVDDHINDTNNPHNVSTDAPVDDVNGQTGSVNLDYNDVGAKSDSYSAPVDDVNGQTGSVSISTGLDASVVATGQASDGSLNYMIQSTVDGYGDEIFITDNSGTTTVTIYNGSYTSSYLVAIGPDSADETVNYAVIEV